jgi:hypothetical protein
MMGGVWGVGLRISRLRDARTFWEGDADTSNTKRQAADDRDAGTQDAGPDALDLNLMSGLGSRV